MGAYKYGKRGGQKPDAMNNVNRIPDYGYDDRKLWKRALAALWARIKRSQYRHRIKLYPIWFALAVWPLAVAGRITVWAGEPTYVWLTIGVLVLLAAMFGLIQVKGKRDRVYYVAGIAGCLAWLSTASFWLTEAFGVLVYAWLLATVLTMVGWLWDHRIRTWMRLQRAGDQFENTLDIAGYGVVAQLAVVEELDKLTGKVKFVRHDLRVPRGMDRDQITARQIEASLPAARANSVTIIKPSHNRRLLSAQYVPYDPWQTDKGVDKPIQHPLFNAVREINKRLTAAGLHKLNGGGEVPEAFKAALPPELRRWVPAGASVSEGIPLGNRDDGTPIVWIVWDAKHGTHHLLVGGQKGGGKTNFVNALVAAFVPFYDAILWGIDVRKKGAAFVHWGRCLDWVATDPEEATFMLRAGRALIEGRGERAVRERRMTDKLHPSRREPLLIILMDEGAALTNGDHEWCSDAMKAGEEIATGGRSECVTEAFVTQRPTVDTCSGTWRAQMDDRMSFRNSNKAEGRFVLNSWDDLDTGSLEHDGMFFAEFGLKATDARLCRAYKFCDPVEIAKIAPLYEPHRPQFGEDDTEIIMRIAGPYYARRFDWLDPNKPRRSQTATVDPAWETSKNLNPIGAPTMTKPDPTAGPQIFARPEAEVPHQRSLIETDAVVRTAAFGHAAALDSAADELESLNIPKCPPGGDIAELVKHNTSYTEPVDLNGDPVTRRIWETVLNRREQGIQMGELVELVNASESTVRRRLIAMSDANPKMAFSTGGGRSTRWFANMEHPIARQAVTASA